MDTFLTEHGGTIISGLIAVLTLAFMLLVLAVVGTMHTAQIEELAGE